MLSAQQTTVADFLQRFHNADEINALTTASEWLVDSTYCFNVNQESGEEFPTNRQYNAEYNEDGRILLQFDQVYIEGNYVNTDRRHFTYGVGEFLTESRHEVWDGETNAWTNSDRILFTYNPAAEAYSEYIYQNFINGNWVNSSRTVDTHNATHQKLDKTEGYLWENGAWVKDFEFIYSVNITTLNTVATLFKKRNDAGVLANSSRTFSEFDDSGMNEVRVNHETFQDGVWVPSSRTDRAFDGENRVVSDIQSYYDVNNETYIPQTKLETEYNAGGEIGLISGFGYDDAQGVFIPSYRTTYSYDANDNFTEFSNEIYQNETWVYTGRCELFWSLYQVNATRNFTNLFDCKIPNPYRNGQSFTCDFDQKAELKIFDLSGVLIEAKTVDLNNRIRIKGGLNPGLYIVLLQNDNGILYRKKITIIE